MDRSPELSFEIQTKPNDLMNIWRCPRPRPFQWGKLFVSPGRPLHWIQGLEPPKWKIWSSPSWQLTSPPPFFIMPIERCTKSLQVAYPTSLVDSRDATNRNGVSRASARLTARTTQPATKNCISQNGHHEFGHRAQRAANARGTGQSPARQSSPTAPCQHLDVGTHCHDLFGSPHLLPPD